MGYYVAGSGVGTDQITVTDFLGATATASVHVVALNSAVNYDVTSTALPALGMVGEPISGSPYFTVTNVGLGNGAADVEWKVYLSAGRQPLAGGDIVVDSGTITPGLAAGTSTDVTISGTWPSGPTGTSSSRWRRPTTRAPANWANSPFTLQPRDVNYWVPPVTHLTGTYTGQQVTGQFTIAHQGAAAGSATIFWYVYASLNDTTVGVTDYLLQSGNRGPLGAGPVTSPPIDIDTTWPTVANQVPPARQGLGRG